MLLLPLTDLWVAVCDHVYVAHGTMKPVKCAINLQVGKSYASYM